MTTTARSQRGLAGLGALFGTFLLTIVSIGCGPISGPVVVSGSCTVQVVQKDQDGSLHVLVPPYVVPYVKDRAAAVVIRGQSWAHVHVTQADSAGTVRRDDVVPGAEMATGKRTWGLDAEGPWRFHLQDELNGCAAEFTIEARAS